MGGPLCDEAPELSQMASYCIGDLGSLAGGPEDRKHKILETLSVALLRRTVWVASVGLLRWLPHRLRRSFAASPTA